MGLFDSLMKAAASGDLEKSLDSALDKLENGLDKAAEMAESAAAVVEKHVAKPDAPAENLQQ